VEIVIFVSYGEMLGYDFRYKECMSLLHGGAFKSNEMIFLGSSSVKGAYEGVPLPATMLLFVVFVYPLSR